MPFMVGSEPIRRTLPYLNAGKLVFKDYVKIMCINYNDYMWQDKKVTKELRDFRRKVALDPHHGISQFVYWNVPQIQYKNPDIQIMAIKNITPTPLITCFLQDGQRVIFDVDYHTKEEIVDRLVQTLGKTKKMLDDEAKAREKKDNPANFGSECKRHCICEIPGQVPCPAIISLPNSWRGKFYRSDDVE